MARDSYSSLAEEEEDFYNAFGLLWRYVAFNPHATFTYTQGENNYTFPATSPDWLKWLPSNPTSPHWYTVEKLRALIAAYLTEEYAGGRVRTVREFVSEFNGLKGTAKQKAVTEAAGVSGAYLNDLVDGNDVAEEPVRALLAAMQHESREIKPVALSVIGQEHLSAHLVNYLCVDPDSVKYKKVTGVTGGVPYVLEAAFGWFTDEYDQYGRDKVIGLNWSPTLKDPFQELPSLLGEARADSSDPVAIVVHLASPRLDFTDRGKSTLAIPREIQCVLKETVESITKPWKTMKKRDERVSRQEKEHYLKMQKRQFLSIKEAAYRVMEKAYLWASDNGTLPANVRQIMYAARPWVLELTGGKCWKTSSYCTQHLLPDFIERHPELTANWDVVFDARGHFIEPHTKKQIGLGTLEVRHYIRRWSNDFLEQIETLEIDHFCPTTGPGNRYRYVLFVEKEGFTPLLERARIADHYDLAIMSTKGMSVTAARRLVEELTRQDVTILVIRDFDKSGFSIVHTLRSNTRRHKYTIPPNVVDLGLRLADVEEMDLQSEAVEYDCNVDPRINLRESGATEEECAFLVRGGYPGGWTGERVELNAMTSRQFIDWLEGKLKAAGVQKVVPDQAVLEKAYRRALRQATIQRAIDKVVQDLKSDEQILVPSDLTERVREAITDTAEPWDSAVWRLATTR